MSSSNLNRAIECIVGKSGLSEQELQCMEKCLNKLHPRSHELILQYYGEVKPNRRKLATKLDVSINAIRIQVPRIQAVLRDCLLKCLSKHEDT